MKRTPIIAIWAVFSAFTFAACGKKEAADRPDLHEGEESSPNGVVSLTPANLQHVEIQTETVKRDSLEMTLKAAGRVTENLNKTARVASPLEGRLEKLNFDIGDAVEAGDVLAIVQSPELLGRPLEIKSPLAGVVTERKVAVGELVDKSSAIYTVSDPADLWVIAEVKERDIAAVKVGQTAIFNVLAYPSVAFTGEVVRIGSQVESESRTLEVRLATGNRDGRLKPGMFADVEITTTVLDNVLVISDAALQTDENSQVAFVALGDSRFEKRAVQPGLEHRGRVQVLGGLEEGDTVVTVGSFILKSELLKGEMGEHSHD